MPGSVFQRGDIYWIKFYTRGKKYERSAKTTKKREAQDLLTFYLSQVVRGEFKGFAQDSLVMNELFDAFIRDCTRRKLRGVDIIGYHVKHLREWFGQMNVDHVTERDISRYIDSRLEKVKETTINRELHYLGQTLRLAKRRKLIQEIPHIEKFSEQDNVWQGFFAHEDFERLVSFLPDELKDFVRFGYFTGWRLGQIQALEWGEVEDGVIRLGPEKVKNKHGLVLPLVGGIAAIIERRQRVRLEGVPWVFYRHQRKVIRPVGRFDKAWKTACEKAGLPVGKKDKRLFHDLRRTTARNLNRAGVPDPIAMRIMGHKTRAMYDRYNIVNEEDIGTALTQVEAHRKCSSHNLATLEGMRED